MNIFSWILGDPNNAAADADYVAAQKSLKMARIKGDRAGEQAAIFAMRKAAHKSQQTAQDSIANVEKVDAVIETVKKSFQVGSVVLLGVGVLVVVVALK